MNVKNKINLIKIIENFIEVIKDNSNYIINNGGLNILFGLVFYHTKYELLIEKINLAIYNLCLENNFSKKYLINLDIINFLKKNYLNYSKLINEIQINFWWKPIIENNIDYKKEFLFKN